MEAVSDRNLGPQSLTAWDVLLAAFSGVDGWGCVTWSAVSGTARTAAALPPALWLVTGFGQGVANFFARGAFCLESINQRPYGFTRRFVFDAGGLTFDLDLFDRRQFDTKLGEFRLQRGMGILAWYVRFPQ